MRYRLFLLCALQYCRLTLVSVDINSDKIERSAERVKPIDFPLVLILAIALDLPIV